MACTVSVYLQYQGVIKQNLYRTVLLYFIIMSYIVLKILNETRPMWYYILAAALFILSQLAWFLLSRVVCKVTLDVSIYLLTRD